MGESQRAAVKNVELNKIKKKEKERKKKNHVFHGVWIDFPILDSVLLVLLSVLMQMQGCFHYCGSIVVF